MSTWDTVLRPRQTGLGSSARPHLPPTLSASLCVSPPSGGRGKSAEEQPTREGGDGERPSLGEDGRCYRSSHLLYARPCVGFLSYFLFFIFHSNKSNFLAFKNDRVQGGDAGWGHVIQVPASLCPAYSLS